MQAEISRQCHLYGLHTHLWQVFRSFMSDTEILEGVSPAALYGKGGADSEVQGGALPFDFGVI